MEKPKAREPQQKRSIDKKKRIMSAAMKLFTETGFDNTSISAIAGMAKVSVGIVYNYFEDKNAIFIEIFDNYLKAHQRIINTALIDGDEPFDLDYLIDKWIDMFLAMYEKSDIALSEFISTINRHEALAQHFFQYNEVYFPMFAQKLVDNGINGHMIMEKLHASYILINGLCREKSYIGHEHVDFDSLRTVTGQMIKSVLRS